MNTRKDSAVDRRAFVANMVAGAPEALFISGLGSPSYDLFAAGDRDKNFYLWGAMGASTCLGLGLALAQPEHSVVVVTGDGEQLMGIGSLGTVGVKQPANLTIVALDNGHFGETGMQRSHASLGTDLVAVAKGFGIEDAFTIEEDAGFSEVVSRINARNGTAFARIVVKPDEPPRVLPNRDGTLIKNRFRAALGLIPF